MNLTEAIAELRPIQAHHSAPEGTHVGFFMQDATAVFGDLAKASEMLTLLMVQGLLESAPVVMNGEVHTIYRIADSTQPVSRSVH